MTHQCKQTYNSSELRSSQELGGDEYDIPVQTRHTTAANCAALRSWVETSMTYQCKQTYNSSKLHSSQELGGDEYDIPVQTDIQQQQTAQFSGVGWRGV